MGVDIGHVGERGKKGGGHWVWRLAKEQDSQDGLCDKSGHLDKSGQLDNPEEANKMATPTITVGTNSNKMATQDAQGQVDTLITSVQQGGHLDSSIGDGEVRV